jgi:oligoribonuclease (3'-5' exoribonuclease)
MLQEAITRRITVERLLGIGVPKRTPIVLQAIGIQGVKHHVKNELEVLDTIIDLGMNALSQSPTIKIETALKAIELKNKLTDGKHAGLTGYGLDQLRELEQAKFNAMIEVVLKYVPEDKHEELDAAIAAAERQFYHDRAPELLEEYEKAVQEGMKEINPNDVIVEDE